MTLRMLLQAGTSETRTLDPPSFTMSMTVTLPGLPWKRSTSSRDPSSVALCFMASSCGWRERRRCVEGQRATAGDEQRMDCQARALWLSSGRG